MKIEDVKRGSIIEDTITTERYLVVKITKDKNSIKALDQEFNPVAIGINPWIKDYKLVEDVDMDKLISYLKKGKFEDLDEFSIIMG